VQRALTAAEEGAAFFKKLGAEGEYAVIRGLIADIYEARGELDEALRIRREEQMPVYERLGDVRELLVARTNLAINLMQLDPPQAEEAGALLRLALAEAQRMKIPEAGRGRFGNGWRILGCLNQDSPDERIFRMKGVSNILEILES